MDDIVRIGDSELGNISIVSEIFGNSLSAIKVLEILKRVLFSNHKSVTV